MSMMKYSALAALAFGFAACGSNQAYLAQRPANEAMHLQAQCKHSGVTTSETERADALLASSQKHSKDGDLEPARTDAELSGILYRLALAKQDLATGDAQVEALKKALAKDQDQLQTYQEILQEVK